MSFKHIYIFTTKDHYIGNCLENFRNQKRDRFFFFFFLFAHTQAVPYQK